MRSIGLQIAAQSGKTTALLAIALEYAFQHPGTVLFYAPDEETARSIGSKAIDIVLASPVYKAALQTYGNGSITKQALTSGGIYFKTGGSLVLMSAGGVSSFRSRTASLVIVDELDAIEANASITGMGDVVARASGRSNATIAPKLLLASTPTDFAIGISKHRNTSRAYVWETPCPHCGEYQRLSLEQLKWSKTERDHMILADTLASGAQTPTYQCEHCHRQIQESAKLNMVEAGRPVCIENDRLSMRHVSLQISALYSTNEQVSWGKVASSFIQSAHDKSIAQAFYTEVMASPTQKYASAPIRRDDGPLVCDPTHIRGVVPPNVLRLITGIDVQGKSADEFWYASLGIAPEGNVYVVDWGHIHGTPNLMATLQTPLLRANGEALSRTINMIDTGYCASDIYRLISLQPQLGLIPVKGANDQSRGNSHVMWTSTVDGYPGMQLHMCHPIRSQDLLSDHIDNRKNGRITDTLILPDGADKSELWQHLISEQKFQGLKGPVYRTVSEKAANHLRDCCRYALAFAHKAGLLVLNASQVQTNQSAQQPVRANPFKQMIFR